MNEVSGKMHETPGSPVRASRNAGYFHAPVICWAMSTALGGLILGWLGAAGSYDQPLIIRVAIWLGLCAIAAVFALFIEAGLLRSGLRNRGPIIWWIALAGCLALAMVPIIFLLNSLGGTAPLAMLPTFLGNSLIISGALAAVRMTIGEILSARMATDTGSSAQPPILIRLKPALREAQLKALKSEGHYVQVFTDAGNEMVLMRFGDAIAEAKGCEGMQVHRSWWVARSAVADSLQSDGKIELDIGDGILVPVSRSYRSAWREANW